MKNLWLLVKVQLQNYLLRPRKRNRKNGATTPVSPLVALLPFLVLVYVSVVYSYMFMSSLPSGQSYIVLYLMAGVTVILCLFYGISLAMGSLFAFKDFDMLMALPLKSNIVVLSKLLSFYAMELLYGLFTFIPSLIIYGIKVQAGFVYYLLGIIGALFLPVIPVILASLIAVVIRKLAGMTKHHNLWANLLSIVAFAAFMIAIFSMSSLSDAQAANIFGKIGAILELFPNVQWYLQGILEPNLGWFALAILMNVVIAVVFVYLFSPSILKINATITDTYHVKNFKLGRLQRNSVIKTLFHKEVKRFLGNFMYMMNTAVGEIMFIIFAVYLVWNKDMVLGLLHQMGIVDTNQVVLLILVAMATFTGLMCSISGVSISLEGKNLWLLKTFPVRTQDIFLAKILLSEIVVLIPSLIGMAIIAIVFQFNWLYWLLGIAYLIAMSFFVSGGYLVINLLLPKLDFDRDIIVIKQSASTFVCVMGGMVLSIGLIVLYLLVLIKYLEPFAYVLILLGFFTLIDIIVVYYLNHGGIKRFNRLYN